MVTRKLLATFIVMLSATVSLMAQTTVIKTNLLYDLTANANVAVETAVAPKWTFDMSANLNLWKFSGGKQ